MSQFCKLFTADFIIISPSVLYNGIKGWDLDVGEIRGLLYMNWVKIRIPSNARNFYCFDIWAVRVLAIRKDDESIKTK
jgi:hypothetical protein